jgi:hypothetical protein
LNAFDCAVRQRHDFRLRHVADSAQNSDDVIAQSPHVVFVKFRDNLIHDVSRAAGEFEVTALFQFLERIRQFAKHRLDDFLRVSAEFNGAFQRTE